MLTPTEVRTANRIYDDRDECYQQYIAAVKLATAWQQRYDIQVRQLDALGTEIMTREDIQNLTDAEYVQLEKQVKRLSGALKRWKFAVWILAGYSVATTVVVAVVVGV